MTFRLRKYLPGWPAFLLVPAVLGLWVVLFIPHTETDWSSLGIPGRRLSSLQNAELESRYKPQGFPFTFSAGWEAQITSRQAVYRWTGFQMTWFLLDLIIALTVAYLFAMAIERLLFPLARRLHRKKPEQGEPG